MESQGLAPATESSELGALEKLENRVVEIVEQRFTITQQDTSVEESSNINHNTTTQVNFGDRKRTDLKREEKSVLSDTQPTCELQQAPRLSQFLVRVIATIGDGGHYRFFIGNGEGIFAPAEESETFHREGLRLEAMSDWPTQIQGVIGHEGNFIWQCVA